MSTGPISTICFIKTLKQSTELYQNHQKSIIINYFQHITLNTSIELGYTKSRVEHHGTVKCRSN